MVKVTVCPFHKRVFALRYISINLRVVNFLNSDTSTNDDIQSSSDKERKSIPGPRSFRTNPTIEDIPRKDKDINKEVANKHKYSQRLRDGIQVRCAAP